MKAWNIRGCRVEAAASTIPGCVEIREIWAEGQVAQRITLPCERYRVKGFLPSGNVRDVADALLSCAAEATSNKTT